MNLNYKDTFIDRRAGEDRRELNLDLWPKKVERRKRPDRRIGGLDVDITTIDEEEFFKIFSRYLTARQHIPK